MSSREIPLPTPANDRRGDLASDLACCSSCTCVPLRVVPVVVAVAQRRLVLSSSATTSTVERALSSSAVQLRCWSRSHLLTADQPPQSPEQWERWWLQVTRQAIATSYLTHDGKPGPGRDDQTRLVHASCQRALKARERRKPALQPAPSVRLA